jgi:hypothetical protein
MSRITDLMVVEYITQAHCTDPACQKCAARVRWLRRKAWRAGKATIHENNGRK